MLDLEQEMSRCRVCPRKCGADREHGKTGYCKAPSGVAAARAALHFWEEPCISGTTGSGTVFFSGCNLRCVYCQNHHIAEMESGKVISIGRLSDIFLELQAQNANNINLVTPSHYVLQIREALLLAKEKGLTVPIVYNCGGYESVEALQALDGLIDIYLPDFKYSDAALAKELSAAPEYPQIASAAILEMYRQTGPFQLDDDGMLQRGVLIRHLILPQQGENTRRVIDWVGQTFAPGQVLFSLMSQYTPVGDLARWPELQHPISPELNEEMYQYLIDSPITDGFYQDLDAATGDMIPAFDGTGV